MPQRPASRVAELWDEGRADIASAEDEQAVRRDVRRLLQILKTDPFDVTRDPDILMGVTPQLANVSAECMRQVAGYVCSSLESTQRRPMSLANTRILSGGEIVFRIACARRGVASPLPGERCGSKAPSEKCKCRFQCDLHGDGHLTIKNHSDDRVHHPDCKPANTVWMQNRPTTQRHLMSPTVIQAAISMEASRRKTDGTLTTRQHRVALASELEKVLPDKVPPARGMLRAMVNEVKLEANDDVDLAAELEKLLSFLSAPEHFEVSTLLKVECDEEIDDFDEEDVEENAGAADGVREFASVAWHDKRLAPPADCKVAVVTSDVSFGLTDPLTGFDKLDLYTSLSPGREAHLLMAAITSNESARTFRHQMLLLRKLYPHLAEEEFVLVVDGDPAKILAARHVFKNVVIILCVKHLKDNYVGRRGSGRHGNGNQEDDDDDDRDDDREKDGIEKTYVCNCRVCGREMPVEESDLPSAVEARCELCSESSVSTSSSSSGSFLSRALGAFGAAVAAAAGAAALLTGGSEDERLFMRARESSVTWNACWYKLRNAPTLRICEERMNWFKKYNPEFSKYADYLWRNVGMWAECAFVWRLTFG